MLNRLNTWFGNGWLGIAQLLMTAFCVFLSLSVHEFAHGYAAYKMGDPTAKNMGRLNLSPASHLDPLGAICLFLFGFGWAKPVPINPSNFKSGKMKSGMVITALAGPISNLILAFVSVFAAELLAKLANHGTGIMQTVITVACAMLYVLATMNVSLAVFNLIPIPPLDGSKVLNALLPSRLYFKLMQFERYGLLILIILINTPIFTRLLNFLVRMVYALFSLLLNLIPFF